MPAVDRPAAREFVRKLDSGILGLNALNLFRLLPAADKAAVARILSARASIEDQGSGPRPHMRGGALERSGSCLALSFAWNADLRLFALCTEGEPDGDGGAPDGRICHLGRNCVAAIADSAPELALQVCRRWRTAIERAASLDEESLSCILRGGLEAAAHEPAVSPPAGVSLIVTAFAGTVPVMFTAGLVEGHSFVHREWGYAAAGTGAEAAKAVLSYRGYTGEASREQALYSAYEAIKLSEPAVRIGGKPRIFIHAPSQGDGTSARGGYVADACLEHLEGLWRSLFVPAFLPPLELFPSGWFEACFAPD
jgi:hypothetical protein